MATPQSIRGRGALITEEDHYEEEMSKVLWKRFEEKSKSRLCYNISYQKTKCNCLMENFISSDEQRKSISKLMLSIRKLKYRSFAEYENYILSQLKLRVKGNYHKSEVDRYAIPANPADPPKEKDAEELDNQWICKGFWCFLTGVSKDIFESLDQNQKQLEVSSQVFCTGSSSGGSSSIGSNGIESSDRSCVSDPLFLEEIIGIVSTSSTEETVLNEVMSDDV